MKKELPPRSHKVPFKDIIARIRESFFPVRAYNFKPRKEQVWGEKSIEAGQRFVRFHRHTKSEPITALTVPYEFQGRGLWITVTSDSDLVPHRISLADIGVVPYEDGKVNVINYLLKIEDRIKKSEEERKRQIFEGRTYFHSLANLTRATAYIQAAAESRDPIKRFAYLEACSKELEEGKHSLGELNLTISDILYIINRSYQVPGTKPEKQAIDAIAQSIALAFNRLGKKT